MVDRNEKKIIFELNLCRSSIFSNMSNSFFKSCPAQFLTSHGAVRKTRPRTPQKRKTRPWTPQMTKRIPWTPQTRPPQMRKTRPPQIGTHGTTTTSGASAKIALSASGNAKDKPSCAPVWRTLPTGREAALTCLRRAQVWAADCATCIQKRSAHRGEDRLR